MLLLKIVVALWCTWATAKLIVVAAELEISQRSMEARLADHEYAIQGLIALVAALYDQKAISDRENMTAVSPPYKGSTEDRANEGSQKANNSTKR